MAAKRRSSLSTASPFAALRVNYASRTFVTRHPGLGGRIKALTEP